MKLTLGLLAMVLLVGVPLDVSHHQFNLFYWAWAAALLAVIGPFDWYDWRARRKAKAA